MLKIEIRLNELTNEKLIRFSWNYL